MNIIFLGRLCGQHEGLREPSHGRAAVGQLARHLHHHAAAQRGLRVHLAASAREGLLPGRPAPRAALTTLRANIN